MGARLEDISFVITHLGTVGSVLSFYLRGQYVGRGSLFLEDSSNPEP